MPFVPCPVHVHRPESAFQPTRTLLNNYVGIRPMSSVEERAKGFPPRWLPTTALSVGIIPCVRLGSPSPNITSESDTPQLSILGRFPIHNENMYRPAPSNVTPSPPPMSALDSTVPNSPGHRSHPNDVIILTHARSLFMPTWPVSCARRWAGGASALAPRGVGLRHMAAEEGWVDGGWFAVI